MKPLWRKKGKLIRIDGKLIRCNQCPCPPICGVPLCVTAATFTNEGFASPGCGDTPDSSFVEHLVSPVALTPGENCTWSGLIEIGDSEHNITLERQGDGSFLLTGIGGFPAEKAGPQAPGVYEYDECYPEVSEFPEGSHLRQALSLTIQAGACP